MKDPHNWGDELHKVWRRGIFNGHQGLSLAQVGDTSATEMRGVRPNYVDCAHKVLTDSS